MLLLIAVTASWQPPVWWNDFQRAHKRCGLVFNVDAPLPAGDGVLIEKDFSGFVLSRSHKRPQEPIKCIGAWARKHGLKVRYANF